MCRNERRTLVLLATGLLCLALPVALGCRQQMAYEGRIKPYGESAFFPQQQAARPLVEGTMPRGPIPPASAFASGMQDGAPVTAYPYPVTLEVLQRGRERYGIYCAPCHAMTGGGNGMIVQRGFPNPPSFHTDRLRQAPPGHVVNVIANGFGQMYPYANRVAPSDRWAIAAYIQALQLSQRAPLADLRPDEQARLQEMRR